MIDTLNDRDTYIHRHAPFYPEGVSRASMDLYFHYFPTTKSANAFLNKPAAWLNIITTKIANKSGPYTTIDNQ